MIHILVSFNKNYILPFKVMVHSLAMNNPQEQFHIWLLQHPTAGKHTRWGM